MKLSDQLSIFGFGLITFQNADLCLISLTIIVIMNLLQKNPVGPPCKVYDFSEYKAKRESMRRNVAYKKAA